MVGLGGESIETLRYPRCKHPIDHVQNLLRNPADTTWACPQCGNQGIASEINWRKSAGFSDCFIEITSIFPKEAVPASNLISSLAEFSNSTWNWFYSTTQDRRQPA